MRNRNHNKRCQNKKNIKLAPVLRDIEYYFNFLFDTGYKFASARELSMGDWEITLESLENNIIIYSDGGEINVAFAPRNPDIKNQIGIRTMIYFLSNGEKFIDGYQRSFFDNRRKRFGYLSILLKENLDKILPYFGKDFEKYKNDLILAREKFNDISIKRYMLKKKRRQSPVLR